MLRNEKIENTRAPSDNVVRLSEWRARDTAKLLAYLSERIAAGDVSGLMVQSVDPRGRERFHMTGAYKENPGKALSAAVSLSMRLADAQSGLEDDPI